MADDDDDATGAQCLGENLVLLERVVNVHADLHIMGTWEHADLAFRLATRGIVDALLQPLVLATLDVVEHGDLQFHDDLEVIAPPIDRHAAYLAEKRRKHKASQSLERVLKGSIYSRAPSRVSSRAASRFGAGATSVSGLSWALSGGHKAIRFARLALSLAGDDGRDNADAAETASTKSRARVFSTDPASQSSAMAASSSRYSLASDTARTSRVPVDYAEFRRREDITRDLASREARDQLTARIQRKGNLRLRLRSMLDPSLSVDQEEREAAAKSRSAQRGDARVVASRLALVRESDPSQILATTTTRSHQTTYRPEDYEGLDSGVVVVEPRGQLLVGENCMLVARKTREELRKDLVVRTNIQPRIHVPLLSEDGASEAPDTAAPTPTRSSPTRAKPKAKSPVDPKKQVSPTHPAFEGHAGSFQSYPKIELDPKKTPLAKGVAIKMPPPPPTTTMTTTVTPATALEPPEVSKRKKPMHKNLAGLSTAIAHVAEDSSNDALDRELSTMLHRSQKPMGIVHAGNTDSVISRPTTRGTLASQAGSRASPVSLTKPNPQHESHLHSLRTRTPAYGNRTPSRIPTALALPRHEETEEPTSDKTVSVNALPRVNYTREFPSPSPGQVHIALPQAAAAALKVPDQRTSRFASLPVVLRGKR